MFPAGTTDDSTKVAGHVVHQVGQQGGQPGHGQQGEQAVAGGEHVAGGVAEPVADRGVDDHRQRDDEEEELRRGRGQEAGRAGAPLADRGDASDDGGADERDPGRLEAERRTRRRTRPVSAARAATTNQANASSRDRLTAGSGRRGSVVAVAPHRGADDHRRRRQCGERHAHREATEGETRGREHEQVGEVRHRQQARRRVRELRGREQRRIRAAPPGLHQLHDHRGEQHRGRIEAHEHRHQRSRPPTRPARDAATSSHARPSTRPRR